MGSENYCFLVPVTVTSNFVRLSLFLVVFVFLSSQSTRYSFISPSSSLLLITANNLSLILSLTFSANGFDKLFHHKAFSKHFPHNSESKVRITHNLTESDPPSPNSFQKNYCVSLVPLVTIPSLLVGGWVSECHRPPTFSPTTGYLSVNLVLYRRLISLSTFMGM